MTIDTLPTEMFDHYGQFDESTRLVAGSGELELVRTHDILTRYLPSAPATLLDVGGATGVHALWLARAGYQVHLIDPIPHHVEQARTASYAQAQYPIASCMVGDARQLEQADQSADAVLLLGPLYHLTDRTDRLKALREAHRVLRPGARVFAAVISRFASLLDGLSGNRLADPLFVEILKQDLQDGQHRNPTKNPEYFTTTFFHHPEEVASEMREADFHVERVIGIEGPVWLMGTFPSLWNDPDRRRLLLDLLRAIEEDASILGASAHVMAVGRRDHRVKSR